MSENFIPIPARLKNVSIGGHVAGAEDIDAGNNKTQQDVNAETAQELSQHSTQIADLQAMEQIVIDGGEAQIAQGSDFDNPTSAQRAKVTTVGAVLDGADGVPTAGSVKPVQSGGVQNELALGAVYDVSAKNPTAGPNNDGKFESLSTLLSDANINTLIPAAVRKGGMSIKYVQTSDNKYVDYRYTSTSTSTADFTSEANWELDVTKKNLSEDFLGLLSELKELPLKNFSITSGGKFGTNSSYKHVALPVSEGEIFYLISDVMAFNVAFATSDSVSSGGDVPFVDGTDITSVYTVGQYAKFVIPTGCTHLLFNKTGSNGDYGVRCYKYYDTIYPMLSLDKFLWANATGGLNVDTVNKEIEITQNTYIHENGSTVKIDGNTAVSFSALTTGKLFGLVYENNAISILPWNDCVGKMLLASIVLSSGEFVSIQFSVLPYSVDGVDFYVTSQVLNNNVQELKTEVNELIETDAKRELDLLVLQTLSPTPIGYYQYVKYEIDDNGIIGNRNGAITSIAYRVNFRKVNKGDILQIKATFNGEGVRAFKCGFSVSRPVNGTALVGYNRIYDTEVTEYFKNIISPIDGWFAYYMYDATYPVTFGVACVEKTQKDIDINSYYSDVFDISLDTRKYIDGAEWNETFGTVIADSHVPTTYGVSELIDVSGCKYIRIQRGTAATTSTSPLLSLLLDGKQPTSMFYNSSEEPIQSVQNLLYYFSATDGYNANSYIYIEVPENAKYFRYFTHRNRVTVGLLKNKIAEDNNTDYKKYIEPIKQALWTNNSRKALGLLHISDIHGDSVAAEMVKNYATKFKDYINDIISTGDACYFFYNSTTATDFSVGDDASHGYKWWTEITELANKCLFVLGNHDCATVDTTEYDVKDGNAAWNGMGQAWAHNTYFAPFAAQLGITLPTGYDDSTSPNYQACYWHKDYPSSKVRVIGLDCMNRYDGGVKQSSQAQETWLAARLADTLASDNAAYGYSVVFLCHFPLEDFSGDNKEWDDTTHEFNYNQKATGGRVMNHRTNSVTSFHLMTVDSYTATYKYNMRNRVGTPSSFTKGDTNYIGDIIQSWVSNGGKYVAWICGHTHKDYMWYSTKYPNLLEVVIDKAGYSRGSDDANKEEGEARMCANFYSIDTLNGLFKIVRLGLGINKLFEKKETFCYDYINGKVLNEN